MKIFLRLMVVLVSVIGRPWSSEGMALAAAYFVTGMIEGEQEILLKSKSQGQITHMPFHEGQDIKAGETLAIIDDTQEVIEKDSAEVELNVAKADFEKTSQLKSYVSAEEIEKKKENYLKKKSVFDLKLYNLENTRIKSPIDGLITKEFIKMGESIGASDKTFEVMQLKNLIIELDVEAAKAINLKVSQKVSFFSGLHGKRNFQATIIYIGPVIDKASGTIRVRLKLPNIVADNKNNKNMKDIKDINDKNYVLRPGTLVKVAL